MAMLILLALLLITLALWSSDVTDVVSKGASTVEPAMNSHPCEVAF